MHPDRWYGEARLWLIVAIANHMSDQEPQHGQMVIQPRLNRRHKVVAGDTPWKLAKDNYGDRGDDRTQTLVALVAAANLIADPNRIRVGHVIYFPSLD